MTKKEFSTTLNTWGKSKTPFLFIVDFEFNKPVAIKLDQVDPSEIRYTISGFSNQPDNHIKEKPALITKHPIPFAAYEQKFNHVFSHLNYGDSYLTNLTIKTEIELRGALSDLFVSTQAPYKLWFKDEFLVFSPECFVRIKGGSIFSYPMKGTIDASLPSAAEIILADPKELAEHVTIVDLIRNDLSQVAGRVRVNRFRYIEEIKTAQKNLLQVSSEIEGILPDDFHSHLGDIITNLLPAGSVSGAPKPKTLQIIGEAEADLRGYYTGIFGYFDGNELDSAVMIRYIEKEAGKFFYRSGGGITTQSSPALEYQEVLDKVYLPLA